MGVLPLEFMPGESISSTQWTGTEEFDLDLANLKPRGTLLMKANTQSTPVTLRVRIDTPQEFEYFKHGGILPYTLRQLL
jgi:aconitate hydratase